MKITIFTLGSLKKELLFLQQDYLKRCQVLKINIQEFKKEKDFIEVLTPQTYLLKEDGLLLTTKKFYSFIFTQPEISFAISDHTGFSSQALNKSKLFLSLSLLTFPHDLARILLLEQLYRSETLFKNHPYHY